MIQEHAFTVGDRLQVARRHTGLTVSRLARLAGITRGQWICREDGFGWSKVDLREAGAIAHAVGLTIDELIPPEFLTPTSPYPTTTKTNTFGVSD